MTTSTLSVPKPRNVSRTTPARAANTRTTEVTGLLDQSGRKTVIRTNGYLPSSKDVTVPAALAGALDLRRGDHIRGIAQNGMLTAVTIVNGAPVDTARPHFADLVPIHPDERLRLETTRNVLATRVIDLFAPIGKGQRGLIVAPPKAGKTMFLKAIANAITTNHPECHLIVVLVDERPEEVTDMRESVRAEVVASTFDRVPQDHITAAELAVERAKRLVETGRDVVVLIDSITRLGRAYNMAAPSGGRVLTGGMDAGALHRPKRVLGAARNIEGGGSLTIIATALVETGSKMDDNLFEEFKSTGNMELKLSRSLADRRVFPAVDVVASGTRREELLLHPAEQPLIWRLRRALQDQEGFERFLASMKNTGSNGELLLALTKGQAATT
ncbi:transcription termination factor Rho [Microbispora bryophytorum]|uniref:transcription termination factor Rho n=1 Tax=Microbispora bryophytorum TaxID=1460882 RepID=UPI003F4CC2C2